jgi:hypothetical protein
VTNPDRKILVMWVIALALITRDELRQGQVLPRPSRYVGSAMVYGLAAVLAEVTGDFAVWLAVGWTLAIFYGTARDTSGKAVSAKAQQTGGK